MSLSLLVLDVAASLLMGPLCPISWGVLTSRKVFLTLYIGIKRYRRGLDGKGLQDGRIGRSRNGTLQCVSLAITLGTIGNTLDIIGIEIALDTHRDSTRHP